MSIFARKGTRFLWCCYGYRGKVVRESTGTADPAQARRFLRQRLDELAVDRQGLKKFVGPFNEKVLMQELFNQLEASYRLQAIRSLPQTLCHLNRARLAFGEYRAAEVDSALVDTWLAKQREDGLQASTLNRTLAMLTRALRMGKDRGLLAAVPRIRKLSELGRARQGFFEKSDLEAVVSYLPSYLRDFTLFAFLAGWRKGEIASLEWQDVDLAGKVIRLRPEHSKNAQGRTLVLEGELWDLVQRRRATQDFARGPVFGHEGQPIADFRKAWATACRAAGCPGKLFHDLRRTAVRNMVRAGIPQVVAMSISGHKTVSVFNRYNIVSETDLRDAQAKLQAHLNQAPERKLRQM